MSQTQRFSPTRLNKTYLSALNKYPLLTKAVTAALLNSLNEQIASLVAGDVKSLTVKLGKHVFVVPHTITSKVPLMAFYGFAINAPFAHFAYKLLNTAFKTPLSPSKKVAQILTSMATITPIISAITVAYISSINNIKFKTLLELLKNKDYNGLKAELLELFGKVKAALKNTLFSVIKSSWFSSPLFMVIAQRFLEPNTWVVFFSLCYFVLGTFNNSQIKRSQMLKQQEEQEQQEEGNSLSEQTSRSSSLADLELTVFEGEDPGIEVVGEDQNLKGHDLDYGYTEESRFRVRQGSSVDGNRFDF